MRVRRIRLPMPRDLKEPAGWRFSSFRKIRLGGLGQHSGGSLLGLQGVYHPAALERAADSTNGVETHGLGRSGDGRLPMVEDSCASWELLPF